MSKRTIEDYQEFSRIWIATQEAGGRTQDVAEKVGVNLRQVNRIRRECESILGMRLPAIGRNIGLSLPVRLDHYQMDIKKAHTILIGSDWHIWPGEHSRAQDAFYHVLEQHSFDTVILNGDVTDQPTVSRFGRGRDEDPPDLVEELEEAQKRVGEVEKLAKKKNKKVDLVWCWGNHDDRLDKYLTRNAMSLEGLKGTTLDDYFPSWRTVISCDIDNGKVVIKHNWHGGIHAGYNNVLRSGTSIITGHTHRLLCRPWSDYTGTRYAVETGCLADPYGPQFSYGQNNPKDHCPGFVIIHLRKYEDGKVDVSPELVDCSLRRPRAYGQEIRID